MNLSLSWTRALHVICIGLLATIFVCSTVASAAPAATLTFKEPEKGSHFTYVDLPPTAPRVDGLPVSVSPGDELILTNRLTKRGKTIGKLRARCTATEAVAKISDADFVQAHFICEGTYTLPGGALYLNGSIIKTGTEGVVTGGTGKYAGARGTFVARDARDGAETSIILLGE